MPEGPKPQSNQYWELITRIGIPLLLASVAFCGKELIALRNDMERVKETRFTQEDGYRLRREILDRPTPKWLEERLLSISASLQELKRQLQELKK